MKKSFFQIVCTLAYMLFPILGYTQEKKSFSLQEAIDYALKNNTSVKNASLDIQEAKWKKWETIATGLPQIDGKIEYTNNVILPDEFSQAAPSEDGGPNLLSFLFPKQQMKPSVTVTQLIFDGTYIVGLQSAKVFLEISKNAKIKTDKEITKTITSAYGNVLLNTESLLIINNNIKNIEDTLKESQKLFDNGLAEEEDLEQLKITLNDLKNNKVRLEQYLDFSKGLLKMLMGLEESATLEISDSLEDLSENTLELKGFGDNFSVFQNIDYQISLNNVESNRLLYKAEQARRLPSLAGFFNLGSQGFAQEFGDFHSNQWYTTGAIGVSLDIPIFTSFQGTAKRKQAKLNWEQAENELEEAKIKIGLDIKNAKADFQLAKNTLINKKDNLNLAERIEKKNNVKYKEGVATSFELRQAQMQLYTSQSEYLQAMVEVINKKAELQSLTK
ncbi:TolC family protein [Ochrovirga pacifica]|uniref:TolC family protein n=1 Tax=Ochrovirga pacifica TaxID=1042376 RepID=UPI000255A00A|nr:TolC family protein [Ochrovirga pacifica]